MCRPDGVIAAFRIILVYPGIKGAVERQYDENSCRNDQCIRAVIAEQGFEIIGQCRRAVGHLCSFCQHGHVRIGQRSYLRLVEQIERICSAHHAGADNGNR